jgi:hypothetical protein
MNTRSMGFPDSPSLDQEYKRWIWDGDKWAVMYLTDYDDAEVRSLISANSTRIDALENAPPVDAYTKAESDGKYQLIGDYAPNGNYAVVGASYTKAESDSKWQPVGSYQPSGNYALVGASYTKSESDGAYVPKTGDTTINGTLTAKDMVATG